MKRKLNLFFVTSLLTSSIFTSLDFAINANVIINPINNPSDPIDKQTAIKYANETSIVPKSLLISQNQGFNTNDLLNNMYTQSRETDINNLTGFNTCNDFINNWTTNLDANSINTIQPLFQGHGINQDSIDKVTTTISSYQKYINYVPIVKQYLNNNFLSQDSTVNLGNAALKSIKFLVPNIDNYLSYSNYLSILTSAVSELVNDWDQPKDFSGGSLVANMSDYMSKKATYSQAWQYNCWNYIENKASNWNWTQFYEFIAGVNFNYIFKLISGKYIGDMITDNIHLSKLSFDTSTFLKTFSDTISKMVNTPSALPYLVKVIIPLLKTEVLKMENPTLGITSVTWKDNSFNKNIAIKTLLLEIQHLLSPAGHNDLVALISNLLGGSFAEDIIIKVTIFWVDHLYTLPELFYYYSSLISINDIAYKSANALTDVLKSIPIDDFISKIINFTNKYLTTNPVIDLQDLSKYLQLTIGSKAFNDAILAIKDIIDNPHSNHNLKEVLAMLGVQFNNESTFKLGSVLENLSTWLNMPNGSLNQLLNIVVTNKDHSGIIDNMIKEQQTFYQDKYIKYFDINNSTYFTVSDVLMNEYQTGNGMISVILSYKMLDKLNGNNYQISFTNNDFMKNKDFKLTLFHKIYI